MPHLIDRETGLCIVCQRNELAAIKEGKKYKRQQYDLRKFTVEETFDPKDPNYREILNRHYVKYDEYMDQSLIQKHEDEMRQVQGKTLEKKIILSDTLPVDNDELITSDKRVTSALDSARFSVASTDKIPVNGDVTMFNKGYRETLRKVSAS